MYRRAFIDFQGMHCHRDDGDHQRQGIDRTVVLKNGKTIWVDEKVRFKSYSDIAIEYLSNDQTGAPGWVEKLLLCDYIAYAIAPKGKGYLMPVPALQAAWKRNKKEWLHHPECKTIAVPNHGYRTWCCCIPDRLLFPEIGKALRVNFTPISEPGNNGTAT